MMTHTRVGIIVSLLFFVFVSSTTPNANVPKSECSKEGGGCPHAQGQKEASILGGHPPVAPGSEAKGCPYHAGDKAKAGAHSHSHDHHEHGHSHSHSDHAHQHDHDKKEGSIPSGHPPVAPGSEAKGCPFHGDKAKAGAHSHTHDHDHEHSHSHDHVHSHDHEKKESLPSGHPPVAAGSEAKGCPFHAGKEKGKAEAGAHSHSHKDHSHDHGHDHGHDHTHDHGHGHSHEQSNQKNDKIPATNKKRTVTQVTNDKSKTDTHSHSHKDHKHDHSHDHSHDHNHDHGHSHGTVKKPKTQSSNSWEIVARNSLVATVCISVFPIVILLLVPLDISSSGSHQARLKVLLAFAVGGLLGDVFLHLIPHAMEGKAHDHSHDHSHDDHGHSHDNTLGLQILSGMLLFFLVEKFAVLQGKSGGHGHSHDGGHGHSHDGGHGHSHEEHKKSDKNKKNNNNNNNNEKEKESEKEKEKDKKKDKKQEQDDDAHQKRLRVSALLNILADTAHNFTDGLAIAASFMISTQTGIVTTIAVLLHEIPHEIGDLAILVKSGYSKRQVIQVQFFTALGAIFGALFGLYVSVSSESTWIIPFTAGGFIYISTTNIIPSLFEGTSFTQSFFEVVAMVVGVGMMFGITYFE